MPAKVTFSGGNGDVTPGADLFTQNANRHRLLHRDSSSIGGLRNSGHGVVLAGEKGGRPAPSTFTPEHDGKFYRLLLPASRAAQISNYQYNHSAGSTYGTITAALPKMSTPIHFYRYIRITVVYYLGTSLQLFQCSLQTKYYHSRIFTHVKE